MDGLMLSEVEALVAFVNTGEAGAPSMVKLVGELGPRRARVACIKLLSWLKSQKRIGKLFPLRVDAQYPWAQDVRHIVEKGTSLKDLFISADGVVRFRENLEQRKIDDMLAFVDGAFQPPLMA
ncbi:MAG TPA: hypothetical protein VG387_03085 [Rhizomicrobium sp.]|jgi:hypothetical protein|nr:hypothetical protein [Rhizomicrobium sp.]